MSTPSPRRALVPDRAPSAGPHHKPLRDCSAGRGSRERRGVSVGCGQARRWAPSSVQPDSPGLQGPRVHHGRCGSSTQGSTPSGRGAPGCGGSHIALRKCDRGVGPTGRSSHKGYRPQSAAPMPSPPREQWPAGTSPGPASSLPWGPATSSAQDRQCAQRPPEASHAVT